jgi:hypothetical protein
MARSDGRLNRKVSITLLILACVVLLIVLIPLTIGPALAQSGAFELFRTTFAPGGASLGVNPGGVYTLDSAAGQAVVGAAAGSGNSGAFELCSGYLCGSAGPLRVFLPLVSR